jgi:hypothetical protein
MESPMTAAPLALVLGVACLLVGLLHTVLLTTRRAPLADPAAHAAHAVMGYGMTAMFVPAVDVVPAPVWVACFAVVTAWFGALALRTGGLFGAAGHHVVGGAAMLFMLLGGHAAHRAHLPAAGGAVDPEHAQHAGGAAGGPGLLITVLALAFAAWFVADLARVLLARSPTPVAAGGAVAVRPALGLGVVGIAGLVMSGAMVVMLIGMA